MVNYREKTQIKISQGKGHTEGRVQEISKCRAFSYPLPVDTWKELTPPSCYVWQYAGCITNHGSSPQPSVSRVFIGTPSHTACMTDLYCPASPWGGVTSFGLQSLQGPELTPHGPKAPTWITLLRLSSGQSPQANKDTSMRQDIPDAQRSPPNSWRRRPGSPLDKVNSSLARRVQKCRIWKDQGGLE